MKAKRAEAAHSPGSVQGILSFLLDIRVLQAIGQIVFAIILVFLISRIATDLLTALADRNLTPNFTFLQTRAGFDITARPDWYSADSNYGEAFVVGLINTIRIVVIGLILATLLGVMMGILLLSRNWLVRTISRVYVEILRNTPLLVQLFFWYFIVMFSLPQFQQSLAFPQEGVVLIGLRLVIYAVGYAMIRIIARNTSQPMIKSALIPGFFAALVMLEIGFRLDSTGNTLLRDQFMLYFILSALAVVAAAFVPRNLTSLVGGLAIGQLIGGLLFYSGLIPAASFRLELYPLFYANIRGFAVPQILPTARFAEWMAFIGIGLALAVAAWIYYGRITETTGRPYPRTLIAVGSILIFAVAGWFFVGAEPGPQTVPVTQEDQIVLTPLSEAIESGAITPQEALYYNMEPVVFVTPQRNNFRFIAGSEISPEYMALLLGLVIYTSAFIAEIVRAGIQAVPYGQLEASRAVGLSGPQTLSLIILPQALRVIIPPLGNQYLNLSKNSSLALAIAFDDVFKITTTIMNQSGQSVTGMLMVMVCYLIMSLLISLFTNTVNRRFQLVTR